MGKRNSEKTETPVDINSLVEELETANENIKNEIEKVITFDDKKKRKKIFRMKLTLGDRN